MKTLSKKLLNERQGLFFLSIILMGMVSFYLIFYVLFPFEGDLSLILLRSDFTLYLVGLLLLMVTPFFIPMLLRAEKFPKNLKWRMLGSGGVIVFALYALPYFFTDNLVDIFGSEAGIKVFFSGFIKFGAAWFVLLTGYYLASGRKYKKELILKDLTNEKQRFIFMTVAIFEIIILGFIFFYQFPFQGEGDLEYLQSLFFTSMFWLSLIINLVWMFKLQTGDEPPKRFQTGGLIALVFIIFAAFAIPYFFTDNLVEALGSEESARAFLDGLHDVILIGFLVLMLGFLLYDLLVRKKYKKLRFW